MRVPPLVLAACAVLSACATPQERCLQPLTGDLATIRSLIAETEQTIARGFAYRQEVSPVRIGGTSGAPASSVIGVRPGIRRGEASAVVRVFVARFVSVVLASSGVVIGSCGRLRRSSGDRSVGASCCGVSAYGY